MTVAISCCLWRFPISDRDPDCMEKLGYTDTETLLWDYSETELYHVLVIPPARARRTLYRITAEYAFQWFGLNGQNNLTVVYYPFSQVNFRNLTDPCVCPPEADAFTATVSVSPSLVLEDAGIPLVFTIRLDRISAFDATVDFTLSGTAIEGVDYSTVAPHSVTITAGALTAQVSVDPLIDLLFESTETVTMALTSGVSGPGLIDVTGAMATGLIIETMAPPLPAWHRALSVIPDPPIWHHVRADSASTFSNGVWLASAAGAAACDPYWDDVVLQLSFDDVNGAVGPFSPGFIDESSHAHGTMFTTFGGEISTAQSVFGGSSARYLGGGHRSTYGDDVDWNLSTRLFTIEYRFRPVSTAFGFHLGQWPSFAGDLGWILYSDTSYSMNISTTGSDNITVFASAAGVFTVDTWHACCVDFDGIKYRAYVNGVMVASSTTLRTIRNSTTLFSIGAGTTGSFSCNCYIDEMRITMDRARYASDSGYTVATQPFPQISCGAAAFPSFVNTGGITQSTSVHTGTLPGSLVGGNLLIMYFKIRSTSNDPTVSAGWTLIDSIIGGGTYRYGAYYCYVNGAQTAPTLTWAGGGQAVSAIVQYQDAKSISPTVAGTKNSAQTGTTISTTAITSTADKSLAISFSWDDAALAPTLPSGFTTEAPEGTFQNVFGSMRLCDKQLAVTGTSSGAVSCTQAASVPWGTILFELKAA